MNERDEPKILVTAEKVAEVLSLPSVASVHRYARLGVIPFIKVSRSRRFDLDEVFAALEKEQDE